MAPGETGDFCNDHYHGGSALDVELTRRVGTTLEEGTEVAVAVETSGSWRRVRASSETPWEPTSSAVCSFFSFLSLSLSLSSLFSFLFSSSPVRGESKAGEGVLSLLDPVLSYVHATLPLRPFLFFFLLLFLATARLSNATVAPEIDTPLTLSVLNESTSRLTDLDRSFFLPFFFMSSLFECLILEKRSFEGF